MARKKSTPKAEEAPAKKAKAEEASDIKYVVIKDGISVGSKLLTGSVSESELLEGKADVQFLLETNAIMEETEWLLQMRKNL